VITVPSILSYRKTIILSSCLLPMPHCHICLTTYNNKIWIVLLYYIDWNVIQCSESAHIIIIIIIIIITTGTTALCEPWPSSGFLNNLMFPVWGCQPHVLPPTWRTRVFLFVWLLPLDLSGLGGPTSTYATAGIALRVSGVLKSHHHDKVGIASVGESAHKWCLFLGKYTWNIDLSTVDICIRGGQ
jgi:hypothetical protein